MSIFNPEQFLQTQYQAKLDTRIPPVKAGEYTAQLASARVRTTQNQDKTETYYLLGLMWEVLDEAVKAETKLDHPQVRQEFFLDVVNSGGALALDMGPAKNTRLGRVREAVRMNDPERPFAIGMMVGSMAKIKVGSRPNPNDPENPFAEVTAVAAL